MAFQIKDFVSIVAGALNHMRGSTDKITDFRVGSVARTLIDGPAVELEELYQQMFIGLREAIPVATFLSFGFGKLPAARALGTVTATRTAAADADLAIPLGTVFLAADGRQYTSTSAVTWPAADLVVQVPVQASTTGSAGNIATGGISSSDFFGGQAVTVSNLPLTTGRDEETDSEREARFAEYIMSLSRGTEAAVRYAVAQAQLLGATGVAEEYVTRVGMEEAGGHVRLYIYSSLGVPSAALLADGQKRIDGYIDADTGVKVPGYRAAGVRCDVLAMSERAVTFGVQVGMFPGYELDTVVVNAMTDIFHAQVLAVQSGATLYVGDLVEGFLGVPGVRQVVPFADNNENILCAENEVLLPGAFAVDPLNG